MLEPTVWPLEPPALTAPGIYAHRTFRIVDDAHDEFVSLSESAWPAFERAFDAEVIGLFRGTSHRQRYWLLTRYASLAAWERSRTEYVSEAEREALARFRRRAALTLWTNAVATRLMPGVAATS